MVKEHGMEWTMLGKRCWRKIKHFWLSGCFFAGIDHFLVVLPSVLIVANVHRAFGPDPIIGLSTIFFMCGLSSLAFLVATKGKIPLFMGPSFAHISLTTYIVSTMAKGASMAEIRGTLLFGYLCSGFCILFLACLYRLDVFKQLYRFLFPDVVMGPSISLIGLSVASLAVGDAGLLTKNETDIQISLVTLGAIILLTLIRRNRLQNASILLGVLVGCVFAAFKGEFDWTAALQARKLFILPPIKLTCPALENWFSIALLVIPPSVVSFIESLGRITVLAGTYERTPPKNENYTGDSLYIYGLLGHSISHIVSAVLGSLPTSIYAENIAIMNINSIRKHREIREENEDRIIRRVYDSYSCYPYATAACFFMLAACFPPLQNLFHTIPNAVIGGMELFIFALVAAPGIQLLVEKRVDYRKVSNQIITGSVLIAGISGVSLKLATVELSGMGLGLIIGVILNGATKVLFIAGLLNEQMQVTDILKLCVHKRVMLRALYLENKDGTLANCLPASYGADAFGSLLRREDMVEKLESSRSVKATLSIDGRQKDVCILNAPDGIKVRFQIQKEQAAKIYNDYSEYIFSMDQGEVVVKVTPKTSPHALREMILTP